MRRLMSVMMSVMMPLVAEEAGGCPLEHVNSQQGFPYEEFEMAGNSDHSCTDWELYVLKPDLGT